MLVQHRPRPSPRKQSFSPARQRLLEMMQAVGYGWVHNLTIQDGDPVLTNPVMASIRLRADKPVEFPRAADLADYALRHQQLAFMELLDRVHTGQIKRILILNGLPSELDKIEVVAA